MLVASCAFAGLAALLHVYIFVMESLTWTSPRTRATFGTTAEEKGGPGDIQGHLGVRYLALESLILDAAIGRSSSGGIGASIPVRGASVPRA